MMGFVVMLILGTSALTAHFLELRAVRVTVIGMQR